MRRAPSQVEFSIPTADTGVLLVSDSGYIVVVRPLNGLCGVGTVDPSQAFVTIVRSDGTSVGRLTAADILTKHDIDLSGGHFGGPVWVEVINSEYGEVVAVRATRGPFGLSAGAVAAVRQWRFRPLQVDGKRVKYNGEVAIHFEHEVVQ